MTAYQELLPEDLLAKALTREPLAPSVIRWDAFSRSAAEELVLRTLPGEVEFCTSGSTGPAARWRHTSRQLWTEAVMLADLVGDDRPQAILSFAPPAHLYGLIGTTLLPAALGVPVFFWPRYGLPAPAMDVQHWLIVAIPWSFPVLLRDPSVLGRPEHVTVLHSTATLPSTARELGSVVGEDRFRLIELFGSTETALIAYRQSLPTPRSPRSPDAWTLMPDVRFTDLPAPPGPDHDLARPDETRLGVCSPRLALTPLGHPMAHWTTDDYIERLDERSFRFHGRRSRLIKVNGRRIDLDEVEERLRVAVPCADLACLPVADQLRGEHVELLVAGPEDPAGLARRATDCLRELGATVGWIRIVDHIERSAVGKPRQLDAERENQAVSP